METTERTPAEAALAIVHSDPRAAAFAAEQILETSTDPRERVIALWAEGFAYRELSDLERSEELLRAAVHGADELGDGVLAARITTSLALVVMNRDTPAAALEMIERPIAELDGADRARAVMQRGVIFYHLAQFDDALRDHLDAIEDLRKAQDWVALARIHVNVGSIQSFRRDFDAAEQSLTEAIGLAESIGQSLLAGGAHHNLGHILALRGDVPAALRSFETAAERYEEAGASTDRTSSLMADRARMLANAGLGEEAVEAIDQAYELVRQDIESVEEADIALLAASIRLDAGVPELAGEPAARARSTYVRQGRTGHVPLCDLVLLQASIEYSDLERAVAADRLAGELEQLGWVEEAQTALIFAADRYIAVGDIASAAASLADAARLEAVTLRSRSGRWLAMARRHRLVGDIAAARIAVDAGLSLLEENRGSVGAIELRSRSIESGADLADLGVEIEVERNNASGVIDVIRRARRAERTIGPSAAHDEILAGLLIEFRQIVDDVRTIDQLGPDRVKLRRRQAELERRIRDRARLAPANGVTPPEQATASVNDDGVDRIVAVSLSDDELVEVAATESSTTIRRVALERPIGRLLESIEFALHRLNRADASDASRTVATMMLDEASTELDSILVPPEVRSSSRPLVLTPADALHGLPWRTLPSLRHRSITVSCSVGSPPIARPPGRLLLVAGPDLDHADAEIERIASSVPGSTVIGSSGASINTVIDQISAADIVHIACHGVFRTDNPLFSSLRLADGDLTIFELEHCAALPHTIVLSACNAGQSAGLRGGALLGFANALMQLGLNTVIAPLTPVNDERSVEVMDGLHQRLHRGDDPAHALAAVSTHPDGHLDPTAAAFSCFGV